MIQTYEWFWLVEYHGSEDKRYDKSEFPDGPWDNECDKKQWTDLETGYDCVAVRLPDLGSWCGYVRLLPTHPLYGVGYDAINDYSELEGIHGGLTFSGTRVQANEPQCGLSLEFDFPNINSLIAPVEIDLVDRARTEDFFVGFDCAHYNDVVPGMAKHASAPHRQALLESGTYRDLQFVQLECHMVAEGLRAIELAQVSRVVEGNMKRIKRLIIKPGDRIILDI